MEMEKKIVQLWLPGFEPKTTEQPYLPGFEQDDIEPSESDVEEASK